MKIFLLIILSFISVFLLFAVLNATTAKSRYELLFDNRPKNPEMFFPENNEVIKSGNIKFVWAEGEKQTIKYNFELYKQNFTNVKYELFENEMLLTDTVYIVKGLQPGKYRWRIRAANHKGWGPFSQSYCYFSIPGNESEDSILKK